jgi:hypothetical protein
MPRQLIHKAAAKDSSFVTVKRVVRVIGASAEKKTVCAIVNATKVCHAVTNNLNLLIFVVFFICYVLILFVLYFIGRDKLLIIYGMAAPLFVY